MNLRISELPDLSALEENDYLVLQRSSGNNRQSYKISFADFSADFFAHFNGVNVKSASSCDASLFAPFAHGHDYTDFWYFPSYGPNSFNHDPDSRNKLCCIYDGKFNVVKYLPGVNQKSVHTISAWQPPSYNEVINEIENYAIYEPGDIQLLAVRDFKNYLTAYRSYSLDSAGNIDINNSSFDGFVIPNGQTFTCSTNKFKSACRLYSQSKQETATSFTVPDLRNVFVKCDPGLPSSQMQPLHKVNYHNALVEHNHGGQLTMAASDNNIQMTLNDVIFTARLSDTGKSQYKNAVHLGYGTKPIPSLSYDEYANGLRPSIKEMNLTCNCTATECSTTGDNTESYPNHFHVQALLYIGMDNE